MMSRTSRWMLAAVAAASLSLPSATPAFAQYRGDAACWNYQGRDRARCERDTSRNDREEDRRDWERKRRKEAKADGVVAGVVTAAIVGGLIAAAANDSKKNRSNRDRRAYCVDRYGNYDDRSDSYQAYDGRWYRCE